MFFETLEDRRLMSVTLSDEGVLMIKGTQRSDVINVSKSGRVLTVVDNGRKYTFDAGKVKRIEAKVGKGDDVFAAHGSIAKRMIVDGEAGNDNIRGGQGPDVLMGGDGNDSLNGQLGDDQLTGDAGRDVIDAQDDLVYGAIAGARHQVDTIFADGDGEADQISTDSMDDRVYADEGLDNVDGRPWDDPKTIGSNWIDEPLYIEPWDYGERIVLGWAPTAAA